MKKLFGFLLILLIAISIDGCKKNSSFSALFPDLADEAAGTYSGTYTHGSLTYEGTVKITEQSSSTVKVTWTMPDHSTRDITGITVGDGGAQGVETLHGTGSGDEVTGAVDGSTLYLHVGEIDFTGRRQ